MLASRARDGTYVSHGADGTSVVTITYPDVAPCRAANASTTETGPRAAEAAVHLALGIEAGFRGDPAWRVHSARRAVYDELGDARDAARAHAPNVRLGGHGARAPVPRFEDRGEVCHDAFLRVFFCFCYLRTIALSIFGAWGFT